MSTRWPIAWQQDDGYRDLWARLVLCHGYDRAKSIVAGEDPKTNADMASWRSLGREKAA